MEANFNLHKTGNILVQVAQSKGTEWMVSSYNEWQQRSPLPSADQRNPSSLKRLVSRMAQKETQLNSVMALSFRSVLLILGLILSVKGR